MGTRNFKMLVALEASLQDMESLEYGSTEQIDAECASYNISADLFGIDWDDHTYLLKATTEEATNYIRKIVNLPKGN